MPTSRPRRRWPLVAGAVVLVLAVAVTAAVFALDSILLSTARKQAASLSAELGRPLTIDGVATKLRGGLGVRVTGVAVGPGPGEDRPIATLERAEVEVDLLGALGSRGKELHVRDAVLAGLRLNVVRQPDGTTNVQRLTDALAKRPQAAGEAKPAKEPASPADLSAIRVGRAAVENARIAFLDRATPGARELAIDHLDVEVRDLAAGRPLELLLRAAVLAEKQNLELRVAAAPLPATLVPTPVSVRLRAEPIDLAPLAPFVPPSAGFRGGRFQADLDATLGAAVPGGSGPTRVKGGFQATALRFDGQQGGKPLDVVLDSDLEADAGAGDLRIATLRLDAGPAHLTGKGRVTGFTGSSPRVEGLEIVVSGLDPEALAAYYPPLRKQLAGQIAGPIGLSLHGAGGADAQSLELRVDLAPVRLAVPQTLAKAAGAPLSLVARARAGGASAPISFEATLDAAGVDLRPGGSLAKKPGDPLALRAAGTWKQAGAEKQLELSRLDADLLGDKLSGKARATLGGTPKAPTTRFDAELSGASLDLDRLLLPTPKDAAKDAPKGAPKQRSKPLAPEQFAGLEGEARVKLGLVRAKGVDARNVVARVRVKEDEITVEEARLEALGGSVSAGGTKVRLAHPDSPYRIVADLKGIAADRGLALLWDQKVVSGTVDAKLDLTGTHLDSEKLASQLTGALGGAIKGGALLSGDLVGSIVKPIAAKLPFAASKLPEGGTTSLGKDLGFDFQIADGLAKLSKPLEARRPEGDLSLTGGVRLDGSLEMPGTIQLSPDTVARLTGGRARPSSPIPVTFRLAGPAWKPSVTDVSVASAVQAILKDVAAGAIGAPAAQAQQAAETAARDRAAALQKQADEEAARAKSRVQDELKKGIQGLFK